MRAWVIPVEAVRASATAVGEERLKHVADRGGRFEANATVAHTPERGFVATVTYFAEPNSPRRFAVTVPLCWSPQENAA